MKLEQSQLDYLKDRGGNYDRKYGMFNMLLNEIKEDIESVIELFGGTGIQSYYLKNKYDLKRHTIIDKDVKCYKCLKEFNKNSNVFNVDVFKYEDSSDYDLLVCDSVFNKREFDNVTSLINKFKSKYVILTDTGVFNVRFNKEQTYEDYWNRLINKLRETGLVPIKIIYSCDFGMMLLKKRDFDGECSILKMKKEEIDIEWRKYRDEIVSYMMVGGINDGI